jgi:hypothetical protein
MVVDGGFAELRVDVNRRDARRQVTGFLFFVTVCAASKLELRY